MILPMIEVQPTAPVGAKQGALTTVTNAEPSFSATFGESLRDSAEVQRLQSGAGFGTKTGQTASGTAERTAANSETADSRTADSRAAGQIEVPSSKARLQRLQSDSEAKGKGTNEGLAVLVKTPLSASAVSQSIAQLASKASLKTGTALAGTGGSSADKAVPPDGARRADLATNAETAPESVTAADVSAVVTATTIAAGGPETFLEVASGNGRFAAIDPRAAGQGNFIQPSRSSKAEVRTPSKLANAAGKNAAGGAAATVIASPESRGHIVAAVTVADARLDVPSTAGGAIAAGESRPVAAGAEISAGLTTGVAATNLTATSLTARAQFTRSLSSAAQADGSVAAGGGKPLDLDTAEHAAAAPSLTATVGLGAEVGVVSQGGAKSQPAGPLERAVETAPSGSSLGRNASDAAVNADGSLLEMQKAPADPGTGKAADTSSILNAVHAMHADRAATGIEKGQTAGAKLESNAGLGAASPRETVRGAQMHVALATEPAASNPKALATAAGQNRSSQSSGRTAGSATYPAPGTPLRATAEPEVQGRAIAAKQSIAAVEQPAEGSAKQPEQSSARPGSSRESGSASSGAGAGASIAGAASAASASAHAAGTGGVADVLAVSTPSGTVAAASPAGVQAAASNLPAAPALREMPVTGAVSPTSGGGVVRALRETEGAARTDIAGISEPHRTLLATPTTLEVGVPDGTQGWLRIRAEVGDQGTVSAALTAPSSASQEMLHRELPALNAYLHSEQMAVTATVTERGLAGAAQGGLADGLARSSTGDGGMTHGGAAGGEQAAGQAGGGEASNGQPGNGGSSNGYVGDAGRSVATIDDVPQRDAVRGYSDRAGLGEAAARSAVTGGESGQWLNVRA